MGGCSSLLSMSRNCVYHTCKYTPPIRLSSFLWVFADRYDKSAPSLQVEWIASIWIASIPLQGTTFTLLHGNLASSASCLSAVPNGHSSYSINSARWHRRVSQYSQGWLFTAFYILLNILGSCH